MVISFLLRCGGAFDISTNGDGRIRQTPASFLDSSIRPGWLGSSACGGACSGWPWCCCAPVVAGGYAVADRDQTGAGDAAARSSRCRRSRPPYRRPARRPTRPTRTTAPLDPTCPARPRPAAQARRQRRRGQGRRPGRLACRTSPPRRTCGTSSSPGNPLCTYLLRVTIQCAAPNVSISVAKAHHGSRPWRSPRPTATSADFNVTAQTDDTFEATYIHGRPPARDHGAVGLLRRHHGLRVRGGDRPERRPGGAARPARPDHRRSLARRSTARAGHGRS